MNVRQRQSGPAAGWRAIGVVAFALAMLLRVPAPAASRPSWTQEFDLVPGWNAIYLQVQPDTADPEILFADLPVRSVWTRGIEPGGVEFVCEGEQPPCAPSPAEALLRQRGWVVYVPPEREEALAAELARRQLVSIEGNRPFLIRLDGTAPRKLSITGQPLLPVINWQPATFNLVGFPVDPAAPPTVESYFAASPAHNGQPVYRLRSDGVWVDVRAEKACTGGSRAGASCTAATDCAGAPCVPVDDKIRNGRAYWVYSANSSDFIAPLAVEMPTSDGLSYGRSVSQHLLRLTNLAAERTTIRLASVAAPNTEPLVPLSHFRVGTDGKFEWIPLAGDPPVLQLPANPYASRGARLAVRRSAMSDPYAASVLAVSDGRGTRWIIPVLAARDAGENLFDGGAAGLGGSAQDDPKAGLWVGVALVKRVSQPPRRASDPMPTPAPTSGQGNVCVGGTRHGLSCESNDGCPGLCAAAPKVCGAGINQGLPCTAASDCPGAECATAGVCTGGARPCLSNAQCPQQGSTCSTAHTSVCRGGANDGLPCTAPGGCPARCEDAGAGSEFPLRLLVHVSGSGTANLLKHVTQMRQKDADTLVLVTDDAQLSKYTGAALRDGTAAGRRISAPQFDFDPVVSPNASPDGNAIGLSGTFGSGALSATLIMSPAHPTNPFLHRYHPDHDSRTALGQRLPDDAEVYRISRVITLNFTSQDPEGFSDPDFGHDTVAGTYRETISGLHARDIRVEGTFRLERVAHTAELNP